MKTRTRILPLLYALAACAQSEPTRPTAPNRDERGPVTAATSPPVTENSIGMEFINLRSSFRKP